DNGGSKLYVTRIYESTNPNDANAGKAVFAVSTHPGVTLRARFPGVAGDVRAIFTVKAGPNVLSIGADGTVSLRGVRPTDVVYVKAAGSHISSPSLEGFYDIAQSGADIVLDNAAPGVVHLSALGHPNAYRVHVITLVVSVQRPGMFELEEGIGEF